MSNYLDKTGLTHFFEGLKSLFARRDQIHEFECVRDEVITGVTFHTFWEITPTASNQVYGLAVHPGTGCLYRVYSNKGALSVSNYFQSNVSYATYINGYLSAVPYGSYIWAGQAIAAKRFAIEAENGKIYPITNTTVNIPMGARVWYVHAAINANAAGANTNVTCMRDVVVATAATGCTHPTFATYDRVYLQLSKDANGNLHSDATIVTEDGLVEGKYYTYLGHMRSATQMVFGRSTPIECYGAEDVFPITNARIDQIMV